MSDTPPAPGLGPLDLRWYDSIRDLADPWQRCFGTTDVMRGYALHLATELAQLPDVALQYLVGSDAEGIACLIPCFSFRVSLVSVASRWLQRVVGWVRTVVPGFLSVRLFVVGSPISTCGDLLGIRDLDNRDRWSDARIRQIFDAVIARGRSLGIDLVLIKELDEQLCARLRPALSPQFFFVDSLPTTRLTIAPQDQGGYEGSLRSKYRNKLKKRKAVGVDHGLTWEIHPHCQGREKDVFTLYQQVIEHSHVVFELLNPAFFLQVTEQLGTQAFYLLGFRDEPGVGKTLVASELVIIDGTWIHPLYSGFDYQLKRDSDLYFNTFYAVIEEAERQGLAQVHLGQTAYEVKAELGAACVPLSLGVHHRWAIGRFVLHALRGVLFPATTFPHREVFNDAKPKRKMRKPTVSHDIAVRDVRSDEA
jgi:hypothetical protein